MKKIFKRGMSGLLAVLMALTVLAGFGTTTAFAASETAESYMISFPRDRDAAQIYSEDAWGHSVKTYMNGWATGSSNYTTLHCMDSFDGKVCYCIEPGLSRNVGDTYYGLGEDFWENYPSQYNNTIQPDDIKLLLGRIMQYGYQGNLSTSWRSQNDSDADKLAHAFATQLLVWETVVGERDADFDHVSTGGYDEILSLVSPNHPLYSRIMDYYDSIESSVQSHAVCPSFMSRSSGGAKTIELAWDGSQYIAELTDTNRVLSQFTFSASETGFHFSVSGNTLTITTDTAPSGNVTISASRSASRCGVLVWTDYKYGPNGGVQDTVTYTASVSDPVRAFLKLKVSYGGAKIIKTSEDGKVDGITFTITGEGVNQSVTTDRNGEIRIENLMPGTYTVTEQSYNRYVPQESHRVTVLAGQTATVSFNNVLRRGDLTVTKTSEDGLNQGVKFHLFGTSLSGLPVGEYAVTDENGVATFRDVLIGTGYTLEEMDTAIRYVVPDSQSAAVEWNSATNELHSSLGGGSDSERSDLRVTLPTVEQQQEIIAEAEEEKSSAFSISQEDIDAILTRGSGIHQGKFRIYEQFLKQDSSENNIAFLKNEYGIGGAYPAVSGRNLDESHDAKGIKISRGRISRPDAEMLLRWNKAEKRIGELIRADRYLSQAEKDNYPAYREQAEARRKRGEISEEFRSIVYDYNDFVAQLGEESKALNLYYLSSCWSAFSVGDKKMHARTAEGDFILPMMREAMNTIIADNSHLTARCEAMLEALNSDVAKSLEPTFDELNPPPEPRKEYRYHLGDTVYIGTQEYELLSFDEKKVVLFDTQFPLFNKELTREEFDNRLKENPLNDRLLQAVEEPPVADNTKARILEEIRAATKMVSDAYTSDYQ